MMTSYIFYETFVYNDMSKMFKIIYQYGHGEDVFAFKSTCRPQNPECHLIIKYS